MSKHDFDKQDFELMLDLMITSMSNSYAALWMLIAEKYKDNPEEIEKKQDEFDNFSNTARVKIVEKIYEDHGDLPDWIKDVLNPKS